MARGAICVPWGTSISQLLGFTFCQKITETSVSELRDQPPSSGRSGALWPFPSLLQGRNHCLGLWGREDPLAQDEPAWHNPCPWRTSAWHGRASLARSMAPESFCLAQESHSGMVHGPRSCWNCSLAVPWPWLCPSASPALPARNECRLPPLQ